MLQRALNKISNKQKAVALLILLGIVGSVLIYLPAHHFDEGESICLSVVIFDMQCYGCGMTRGVQHLIHFDFAEAWRYNKLAFVVFPLLIYLIGSHIYKLYKS